MTLVSIKHYAEIHGKKIIVTGGVNRDLAELPNAFWSRWKFWYEFPATEINALNIAETLGDNLEMSEEFGGLYRKGQGILRADIWKKASDRAINQPEIRKTDSWDHQKRAYNFAMDLRSCLLWCGVGTGKSKISIDVLQNSDYRTVLIVAPAHIVNDPSTWEKQFKTHCNVPYRFEPLVKGTSKDKAKRMAQLLNCATDGERLIMIVNYESVWRGDLGHYIDNHGDRIDMLILDESHKLKSHSSTVSKFLGSVAHQFKKILALTGTALPHNQLDAYGQFRILDSGVFGKSFTTFRAEYADVYDYNGVPIIRGFKNKQQLMSKIEPLTLFVDQDVLHLPEPIHDIRTFSLSPAEKSIYKQMEEEASVDLGDAGYNVTANVLTKMLRLQQITGGYLPLQSEESDNELHLTQIGDSKEKELLEIMTDLPADQKVVVFARFVKDLEAIERVAKKLERSYCQIGAGRHEKELWNEGATVMGINVRAGSGLDLSDSNYAIVYSTGYLSIGDFLQCVGRLRRPPNDRFCYFIHLQAEGTIDEAIYRGLMKNEDSLNEAVEYLRSKIKK